jgi:hypothetical protein
LIARPAHAGDVLKDIAAAVRSIGGYHTASSSACQPHSGQRDGVARQS